MTPELRIEDGYRTLVERYQLPIFGTLTRNQRWHPEAALKAQRYLCHRATQALCGKRYQKAGIPPIQYVAAIERQVNWNPHVHALMGHPYFDLADRRYTSFLAEMKLFAEGEWGFARMERVTATDDARAYVIDYAAKTGELYFSDQLEAMNRGQKCFG